MIRTAAGHARKRLSAPRELNLTSCIDVVFLLLIFFIVTTQFTDREGSCASRHRPGKPGFMPMTTSW